MLRTVSNMMVGLFLMTTAFGCNSADEKLYPAKGKVLVNGQPANGAIVTFVPAQSASDGQVAFGIGTCNENGEYTVQSGGKDGIRAGSYAVTVIWPDPKKKITEADKMMGKQPSDLPDLLQGRYANKEKSQLAATIKPEDNTIADYELKRSVE